MRRTQDLQPDRDYGKNFARIANLSFTIRDIMWGVADPERLRWVRCGGRNERDEEPPQ
jgi:hypothetical protein